jgi:poly(A) polymerase
VHRAPKPEGLASPRTQAQSDTHESLPSGTPAGSSDGNDGPNAQDPSDSDGTAPRKRRRRRRGGATRGAGDGGAADGGGSAAE